MSGEGEITAILGAQMFACAPRESDGYGLGFTDRRTLERTVAEISRLRALVRDAHRAEIRHRGTALVCACGLSLDTTEAHAAHVRSLTGETEDV